MLKNVILFFTNLWYNLFRIGSGDMKEKYNALDIAKYLICKFNNENNTITQLKLQKLLYFIEAYYMAYYDKKALYIEDFYAWTYGPVIKEVYDKYKIYMSEAIIEDDCNNIITLDNETVDSINTICSTFGNHSAYDLIKITHLQGSPWFNTLKPNKISKEETKKWFNNLFLVGSQKNGN